MAALRESGPVPGDENGVKSKRAATGDEGSKKKKRTEKNVRPELPSNLSLLSIFLAMLILSIGRYG